MLTPSKLEAIPHQLEYIWRDYEQRVMRDIVRKIEANREITRTADWQLYRLNQVGLSSEKLKKELQKALKMTEEEINRIYKDILAKEYGSYKELYTQTGKAYIPLKDNDYMQQLFEGIKQQTKAEINNITQTVGFYLDYGKGKRVLSPLAQAYTQLLDGAMLDVSTGAFSFDEALRRVINNMISSGIRTVEYASGKKLNIISASRNALMTGITQIAAKMNEYNADQLGIDTYEVSRHMGARNTGEGYLNHQSWQGKVYTHDELVTVCGLGLPGGLCGVNCRHSYYPYIEGISKRTYNDQELAEMNERENTKVIFRGKEYDGYGATQRQRKLEDLMRKQRKRINLLDDANVTNTILTEERAKYAALSQEYTELSKKFGLPQQRNRIYVDGLGRVG